MLDAGDDTTRDVTDAGLPGGSFDDRRAWMKEQREAWSALDPAAAQQQLLNAVAMAQGWLSVERIAEITGRPAEDIATFVAELRLTLAVRKAPQAVKHAASRTRLSVLGPDVRAAAKAGVSVERIAEIAMLTVDQVNTMVTDLSEASRLQRLHAWYLGRKDANDAADSTDESAQQTPLDALQKAADQVKASITYWEQRRDTESRNLDDAGQRRDDLRRRGARWILADRTFASAAEWIAAVRQVAAALGVSPTAVARHVDGKGPAGGTEFGAAPESIEDGLARLTDVVGAANREVTRAAVELRLVESVLTAIDASVGREQQSRSVPDSSDIRIAVVKAQTELATSFQDLLFVAASRGQELKPEIRRAYQAGVPIKVIANTTGVDFGSILKDVLDIRPDESSNFSAAYLRLLRASKPWTTRFDEAKAEHDAALRNRAAAMLAAHERGFTPEEIAEFAGVDLPAEAIAEIVNGERKRTRDPSRPGSGSGDPGRNDGSDQGGSPVNATSGVPPSGNGGASPASDAPGAGAGTPRATDATDLADPSAERTVPNTREQPRGPPPGPSGNSSTDRGTTNPQAGGPLAVRTEDGIEIVYRDALAGAAARIAGLESERTVATWQAADIGAVDVVTVPGLLTVVSGVSILFWVAERDGRLVVLVDPRVWNAFATLPDDVQQQIKDRELLRVRFPEREKPVSDYDSGNLAITSIAGQLLAEVGVTDSAGLHPLREGPAVWRGTIAGVPEADADQHPDRDGRFVPGLMRWVVVGVGVGSQLLVLVEPSLRELFPRPFDVFSHVGNFVAGGLVAWSAPLLRMWEERRRSGVAYDLTGEQLRSYFLVWVPGVMAVVALLNIAVETAWGMDVVGKQIFPGAVPDLWDLIYSVGFAGVVAAVGWRTASVTWTDRAADVVRGAAGTTVRRLTGRGVQTHGLAGAADGAVLDLAAHHVGRYPSRAATSAETTRRTSGLTARGWRRIGAVVVLAAVLVLVSGGSAVAAPLLAGGTVTAPSLAAALPAVSSWLSAAAVLGPVWAGVGLVVAGAGAVILGWRALRGRVGPQRPSRPVHVAALLVALERAAERAFHRAEAAAVEVVTPELRRRLAWVLLFNERLPSEVRLGEDDLAGKVAEALGLSRRQARRLLTKAGEVHLGEVRPPSGLRVDDGLDVAVAVIGAADPKVAAMAMDMVVTATAAWFRKERNHPDLDRARTLHTAVQEEAAIAAAVEGGEAREVAEERIRREFAAGRMVRVPAVRGVTGRWFALVYRLGLDRPWMSAESRLWSRVDRALEALKGPAAQPVPESAAHVPGEPTALQRAAHFWHQRVADERAAAGKVREIRVGMRTEAYGRAGPGARRWVPAAVVTVVAGGLAILLVGPAGWAVAVPIAVVAVAAGQQAVTRMRAARGHGLGSQRHVRAARVVAGSGVVLAVAGLVVPMVAVPASVVVLAGWVIPATAVVAAVRWAWFAWRVHSDEVGWVRQARAWESTRAGLAGSDPAFLVLTALVEAWRFDADPDRVRAPGRKAQRHFTVDELLEALSELQQAEPDRRWVADAGTWIAAHNRGQLEALLHGMTTGPQALLRETSARKHSWGPSRRLRSLLPRAPPAAVEALLRNPGATLAGTPGEPAERVFTFLRGAVWEHNRVAGMAAGRGLVGQIALRVGEYPKLFEDFRDNVGERKQLEADKKALVGLRAVTLTGSVRGLRLARLRLLFHPRMRTVRDPGAYLADHKVVSRLAELRERRQVVGHELLNRGTLAGYDPGRLARAMMRIEVGFVRGNIAALIGSAHAAAAETSQLTTATADASKHFGVATLPGLNLIVSLLLLVAPVSGLALSLLGDRTIRSMRWVAPVSIAGVAALVAVPVLGGAGVWGFVGVFAALAMWDAMLGGPARAMFDRYFPEPDPLARSMRSAQLQSSFKQGQLLMRGVPMILFLLVGVGNGFLAMGVSFAIVMVAVLVFLSSGVRGKHRTRAGPATPVSKKRVRDVRDGTRGGFGRWVFSIQPLTFLTGLPGYALGGGSLAVLIEMIDLSPVAAMLGFFAPGVSPEVVVAIATLVLSLGSRFVAWRGGTPKIWKRLYPRLGKVSGEDRIDEGNVLIRLAWLALPVVPLAALMAVAPSVWTALALTTYGMLHTGWARTTHNAWTTGARGATLVNVSKGLAPAFGYWVFSQVARGTLFGLDPLWAMAGLAVVFVVAQLVWAKGIAHFHVMPLADLRNKLLEYSPDRGAAIHTALTQAGYATLGPVIKTVLDHPGAGPKAISAHRALFDGIMIEAVEVDDDQLFYLQSRGIPADVARRLLPQTVRRPLNREERAVLLTAVTDLTKTGRALHEHLGPSGLPIWTGPSGHRPDGLATDPAILAALRAAGITTVPEAIKVFLPRLGEEAAAAKRLADIKLLKFRPLTDKEVEDIRVALGAHLDENQRAAGRVTSLDIGRQLIHALRAAGIETTDTAADAFLPRQGHETEAGELRSAIKVLHFRKLTRDEIDYVTDALRKLQPVKDVTPAPAPVRWEKLAALRNRVPGHRALGELMNQIAEAIPTLAATQAGAAHLMGLVGPGASPALLRELGIPASTWRTLDRESRLAAISKVLRSARVHPAGPQENHDRGTVALLGGERGGAAAMAVGGGFGLGGRDDDARLAAIEADLGRIGDLLDDIDEAYGDDKTERAEKLTESALKILRGARSSLESLRRLGEVVGDGQPSELRTRYDRAQWMLWNHSADAALKFVPRAESDKYKAELVVRFVTDFGPAALDALAEHFATVADPAIDGSLLIDHLTNVVHLAAKGSAEPGRQASVWESSTGSDLPGRVVLDERVTSDVGVDRMSGVSIIGRRPSNQDAAGIGAAGHVVAVVADGVSRTRDGQRSENAHLAAQAATDEVGERLVGGGPITTAEAAGRVVEAIEEARRVVEGVEGDPSTTIVAAMITRNGNDTWVTVGWLGDSRAYWVDRNGAHQLTDDLESEPGRPFTLGGAQLAPGVRSFHLAEDGVLLLATDGITRFLSDENGELTDPEVLRILLGAADDPRQAAADLTVTALNRGSSDNLTTVLVPVGSRRPDQEPADGHTTALRDEEDPFINSPATAEKVLGPARAARMSELAHTLGVGEEVVRAAFGRLGEPRVMVGQNLVVLAPVDQRPESGGGSTAAAVRDWDRLVVGATQLYNLMPAASFGELWAAEGLGVVPVRAGTAAARDLLRRGGELVWVVRTDGSLWISPMSKIDQAGVEHPIYHTVPANGEPVLAAGGIFVLTDGSGAIAGINARSGHYLGKLATPEDSDAVLVIGRAAFARHGMHPEFDLLFHNQDGTGERAQLGVKSPDELRSSPSEGNFDVAVPALLLVLGPLTLPAIASTGAVGGTTVALGLTGLVVAVGVGVAVSLVALGIALIVLARAPRAVRHGASAALRDPREPTRGVSPEHNDDVRPRDADATSAEATPRVVDELQVQRWLDIVAGLAGRVRKQPGADDAAELLDEARAKYAEVLGELGDLADQEPWSDELVTVRTALAVAGNTWRTQVSARLTAEVSRMNHLANAIQPGDPQNQLRFDEAWKLGRRVVSVLKNAGDRGERLVFDQITEDRLAKAWQRLAEIEAAGIPHDGSVADRPGNRYELNLAERALFHAFAADLLGKPVVDVPDVKPTVVDVEPFTGGPIDGVGAYTVHHSGGRATILVHQDVVDAAMVGEFVDHEMTYRVEGGYPDEDRVNASRGLMIDLNSGERLRGVVGELVQIPAVRRSTVQRAAVARTSAEVLRRRYQDNGDAASTKLASMVADGSLARLAAGDSEWMTDYVVRGTDRDRVALTAAVLVVGRAGVDRLPTSRRNTDALWVLADFYLAEDLSAIVGDIDALLSLPGEGSDSEYRAAWADLVTVLVADGKILTRNRGVGAAEKRLATQLAGRLGALTAHDERAELLTQVALGLRTIVEARVNPPARRAEGGEPWLGPYEPGRRYTSVDEWPLEDLERIAALSPKEALLEILRMQGMDGLPVLVQESEWWQIAESGHVPASRVIHSTPHAMRWAEQFRSGDRSFIGRARDIRASGTNFANVQKIFGGWISSSTVASASFTSRNYSTPALVLGYLHKDSVTISFEAAELERHVDRERLSERGAKLERLVEKISADLGVWAALRGIDAVWNDYFYMPKFFSAPNFGRQYVVLNRSAMFVDEQPGLRSAAPVWVAEDGRYGTVSLSLVWRDSDGVRVLMTKDRQSQEWVLPHGVRHYRESPEVAALRVLWERAKIDSDWYRVVSWHTEDRDGRPHTSVVAEVNPQAEAAQIQDAVARHRRSYPSQWRDMDPGPPAGRDAEAGRASPAMLAGAGVVLGFAAGIWHFAGPVAAGLVMLAVVVLAIGWRWLRPLVQGWSVRGPTLVRRAAAVAAIVLATGALVFGPSWLVGVSGAGLVGTLGLLLADLTLIMWLLQRMNEGARRAEIEPGWGMGGSFGRAFAVELARREVGRAFAALDFEGLMRAELRVAELQDVMDRVARNNWRKHKKYGPQLSWLDRVTSRRLASLREELRGGRGAGTDRHGVVAWLPVAAAVAWLLDAGGFLGSVPVLSVGLAGLANLVVVGAVVTAVLGMVVFRQRAARGMAALRGVWSSVQARAPPLWAGVRRWSAIVARWIAHGVVVVLTAAVVVVLPAGMEPAAALGGPGQAVAAAEAVPSEQLVAKPSTAAQRDAVRSNDGLPEQLVVQKNDNPSALAQSLNVPLRSTPDDRRVGLLDANRERFRGVDPDLIYPGERLTIPPGWDGGYVVPWGDTFSGIAERFDVDPDRLARAQVNGFADRDRSKIFAGERFEIPGLPVEDGRTGAQGAPPQQDPGRPVEPSPSPSPSTAPPSSQPSPSSSPTVAPVEPSSPPSSSDPSSPPARAPPADRSGLWPAVAGGGLILALAGAVVLRAAGRVARGKREARPTSVAPTRRAERRHLWELRAAVKETDSSLADPAARRLGDAVAASVDAEAAVYELLVGGVRAVVMAAPEETRARVAALAKALAMDRRDVAAIARDRELPATKPDLGSGALDAQVRELVRQLDEARAALRAAADEVATASRELARARQDALADVVRRAADALSTAKISEETGLSAERVSQILGGADHADVADRASRIARLGKVVAGWFTARRGRQAGAGSARGPPATADQLRAALDARTAAIREIPANRWVVEQLPRRWVLERDLRDIAAAMEAEADSGAGFVDKLAALDRHIDTARRAGWNARWRGGTSLLHRSLYVPATFLATGLLLIAMHVMTVLIGAPVVAAALDIAWWTAFLSLFSTAALGQMVGNALLGGLWFRLSPRAMTMASLLGLVAVLTVFVVFPGSATAYFWAAVLGGIVTSGNFFTLDVLQAWVSRTTKLRRDSGRKVIFEDGIVGLTVLGVVVVLSVLLTRAEVLVLISVGATATVIAVITLVTAALVWLVTPAVRWDRPAAPTFREQLFEPLQVVARNRFALNVTAIYAAYPFTMGSIDAEWRPFFEAAQASDAEVTAGRFAFVGGGLVVAAVFGIIDWLNRNKNKSDAAAEDTGLLNRHPVPTALAIAVVMVLGALVGWTAMYLGLFEVPAAVVALWAMEVSTTGLLVALNAVITNSTRLTDREKIAAKLAGAQAKAVFYFLGATIAVSVEHAFHWGGNISVVVAGTLVTFVLTAILLDLTPLWQRARSAGAAAMRVAGLIRDRVRAILAGRSGPDDIDQGGPDRDGGPGDDGPGPSATGGGAGPGTGGPGQAGDVPGAGSDAAASGAQDATRPAARGSVRPPQGESLLLTKPTEQYEHGGGLSPRRRWTRSRDDCRMDCGWCASGNVTPFEAHRT